MGHLCRRFISCIEAGRDILWVWFSFRERFSEQKRSLFCVCFICSFVYKIKTNQLEKQPPASVIGLFTLSKNWTNRHGMYGARIQTTQRRAPHPPNQPANHVCSVMSSTDLPVLIKVEDQLLEEEVGKLGRDMQEGVLCVCVCGGGGVAVESSLTGACMCTE